MTIEQLLKPCEFKGMVHCSTHDSCVWVVDSTRCEAKGGYDLGREAAETRIRELEKALKPFADQYERLRDNAGLEPPYGLEDYKKAYQALCRGEI